MAVTPEDTKAGLLEKAADIAAHRKGAGGPPSGVTADLLRAYYRRVAAEDVCERGEVDLYGALASQLRLAASRPQGTARVRVFTPTVQEHGWTAGGHSVVEIVTDDMPFLVDSVTMALAEDQHTVHVIVHPQFEVVRTITGEMLQVHATSVGVTQEDLDAGHEVVPESWMHVEIDRITDEQDLADVEASLQRVLRDVRDAVEDWPRMQGRLLDIVAELEEHPPPGLPDDELAQSIELLRWLADDHFAFLGYREYHLEGEGEDTSLRAEPATGLGILRGDQLQSTGFQKLPAPVRERAREKKLLVLAKANSKATVHRSAYLDYVGIKSFDDHGDVVGERRFLGLFSAATYTESVQRIPLLREKVAAVIAQAGVDPRSHTGKSLLNVLENYPRDELFHTPVEELAPIAESAMLTRERRQLRLFTRRDTYGRYVSCLVFLPRDRYNTAVRQRLQQILRDELGADSVEFTVRVNEAYLAQVHFVVRPPRGQMIPEFDLAELERKLAEAARSWRDDMAAAVRTDFGEETGARLARLYLDAFPEAYKEDYSPRTGAVDLGRLEAIPGDEGLDMSLYEPVDVADGEARLKVYRIGSPLSLSAVLPVLSSMGVEVIDEWPYDLENLPRPTYLYDFGLRYGGGMPVNSRELFQDAVRAVWDGQNEVDGFNSLVLAAGLTWRQATVLRAYAKYMKQGHSPFAVDYIEEALRSNVDIARLLVTLFETRFDPIVVTSGEEDPAEVRAAREEEVSGKILRALDDVASLDHDRILRSYLTHITATLRTNYFQRTEDGQIRPYMSFKLEPRDIPDLPEPRPRFEIFVYSPRVEGVHLRFGAVARGGLRWSDRRDDFRTEILGLVKAQMVKNTVIVPVGAKGGFFCKQLPDPADRDAWMAEGIACYTTFISGLLDVTDNLVAGEIVPPRDVVRHDGDDAYLVVAADKGTATFSDIANGVAHDYGFWLGDAFASGGSVGYDHKAMGITAKGAWVSVQRHFRERGIDCQTEEFTAVGIGDMSGDVFGNGMLCSEHTRLVAAFDHRDIFLDPDPDAAASYAERQRLFGLPRSSWQDYDTSLISEGGGVFSRKLKSIPLNDAIRRALGIETEQVSMTPAELMRAILLAPVDLIWNGGIGTYVKAATETHADAGDKSNDAIRVDGGELRAKCVGEGGNLGLTQLGRVEYARAGGRINTDFIDNSAGVDTSDHEVNIKILLDRVVHEGDLTGKQRNSLLAEMTDEVASLVLRDNYEQNLALANAAANAPSLLHVHEEWIRILERDGHINRELEGLPSRKDVAGRLERGEALTTPELSVLMSWTKIVLAEELLGSDLPDDPFLHTDLFEYFPSKMRQTYRPQMLDHPLRREIIVTQIVNDLVNGAGITFWPRLSGETGATAAELTNANFVAREIFGSLGLRDEMKSFDNRLDAAVQTSMRIEMRTLVERASRWLVNNRRPPLDSDAVAEFFTVRVMRLMGELPDVLVGQELGHFERRRDGLMAAGVPEELATKVAVLHPAYQLLNIVEIADRHEMDPTETARIHFSLGERLGVPALVGRILQLPRADRWQTMARAALRDDLYAVHAQLTAQVIDETANTAPLEDRIASWEDSHGVRVERAAETLSEICADDSADLARMSVGLRVVRGLLQAG
ncbi:NAD-glutamate dehydrogenase [Nocardioides sp.]|uniref:NAD-glutamate dehydrogenase n=1 Tax=Nocardioides sp. TaxID=35761 RepID=UPI0035271B9F